MARLLLKPADMADPALTAWVRMMAVWTAKYNFTNVISDWLRFDVTYARYNDVYSDTLEVRVPTDCGTSFTSVYLKAGNMLATAP